MLIYRITEEKNIQIEDDKFQNLINKDLQEIISVLTENGYKVRIVGGAVRDILLGETPRDIDLISDATPDEILYLLSAHDIEADSWGIAHGTIKAVINQIKYEITSLDFRIYRDKSGKLKINTGGTWKEDAERRDFTINSMSMTLTGEVFDYLGGIEDLKNQYIRPNPGFEEKIKKDPVVILRFFKMISKLPVAKCSKKTMEIIKRNIPLLNNLDSKRIKKELSNIKKGINAEKTFLLMKRMGVTKILSKLINTKPK